MRLHQALSVRLQKYWVGAGVGRRLLFLISASFLLTSIIAIPTLLIAERSLDLPHVSSYVAVGAMQLGAAMIGRSASRFARRLKSRLGRYCLATVVLTSGYILTVGALACSTWANELALRHRLPGTSAYWGQMSSRARVALHESLFSRGFTEKAELTLDIQPDFYQCLALAIDSALPYAKLRSTEVSLGATVREGRRTKVFNPTLSLSLGAMAWAISLTPLLIALVACWFVVASDPKARVTDG